MLRSPAGSISSAGEVAGVRKELAEQIGGHLRLVEVDRVAAVGQYLDAGGGQHLPPPGREAGGS